MTLSPRPLSCVLSTGLYVPDHEISTLALLFDEIFLPYPFNFDPEAIELPGLRQQPTFMLFGGAFILSDLLPKIQEQFRAWKERYALLFNEGVLRTLDPPEVSEYSSGSSHESRYFVFSAGRGEEQISQCREAFSGAALALYARYSRKPAPEIFLERDPQILASSSDYSMLPLDTSTAKLSGLLGKSLFSYQFPQIATLPAERILELRHFLSREREGFVAYLNSLTEEVERYSKEGPGWEETAARKLVERKIVPQFLEFRRCLESKSASFWSNVLAAGAKFMQIDVSPWTPKFYFALLEAITGSISERGKFEEQSKSNAGQAFQYLAKLESQIPI